MNDYYYTLIGRLVTWFATGYVVGQVIASTIHLWFRNFVRVHGASKIAKAVIELEREKAARS